jgi:hypothetical protein
MSYPVKATVERYFDATRYANAEDLRAVFTMTRSSITIRRAAFRDGTRSSNATSGFSRGASQP